MKADGLLQIAWLIANAEAKNLGATEILPVHFLLATMKIIDPKFPEQLDALDVSSDDWAKMCKEAQSIRHYIDVLPDRVTKKRRTLRARLAQKQVRPPIKEEGFCIVRKARSEHSRTRFSLLMAIPSRSNNWSALSSRWSL